MTEEQENCNGFERSNCCDARLNTDMGLCSDCHDHAETQCADCEEANGCENFKTMDEI